MSETEIILNENQLLNLQIKYPNIYQYVTEETADATAKETTKETTYDITINEDLQNILNLTDKLNLEDLEGIGGYEETQITTEFKVAYPKTEAVTQEGADGTGTPAVTGTGTPARQGAVAGKGGGYRKNHLKLQGGNKKRTRRRIPVGLIASKKRRIRSLKLKNAKSNLNFSTKKK